MAPKKRSAYYYFMLDYLKKEESRGKKFPNGLSDIAPIAASAWEKLSKNERARYDKRFQNEKMNHQKLACNDLPINYIEACQNQEKIEEIEMQSNIDKILENAVQNFYLDELEFNLITFNYFSKSNNCYTPAEIGLSKFNLTEGITKQFHQFIDPQKLPLGMAYTAKNYSETTHKIVPPPNCIGEVFSHKLYEQIIEFLTSNDGAGEVPPLYTFNTHVPIVKSIMQQLCDISNKDFKIFKIYPLCELFFRLKSQTAQFNAKDNTLFNSIFLARALLERDIYDYISNISCDYHEELDCSKYCSLSMVTRWSYFIMNHCSSDLNIELIEGKHIPHNQRTVSGQKNNENEFDKRNYMDNDDESTENEFIFNNNVPDNISMVSATTSMLTEPKITKEPANSVWNRKIQNPNTPNPWKRNLVPARLPNNSIDTNFPALLESDHHSYKNDRKNTSSSDSSTSSFKLWQSFNANSK